MTRRTLIALWVGGLAGWCAIAYLAVTLGVSMHGYGMGALVFLLPVVIVALVMLTIGWLRGDLRKRE